MTPDAIGPYQVLGVLGEGGMGVVYRARDPQLRREVAIKLPIPRDAQLDERMLERFDREARVLARLRHPHIVSVLAAGQHEGRPYLVLELIQGRDLAARVREEGRLDPREAARLMAPIARAVNHAHERQVIHRDLKPDNVLVDRDGQPYLTDFGLTRILDDEGGSSLTRTGTAVGTLYYCSPEQIQDSQHCGPPADIYGLGATLYTLLTGTPPARDARVQRIIERIMTQDWPAPSQVDPRVEQALDEIVATAMALDPARRYPDGEALARDLERFLAGQPLLGVAQDDGAGEETTSLDDADTIIGKAPSSFVRAPGALRTPDPSMVVPAPAPPDPDGVARHHLERGRERLDNGELREALSEFHRAVSLAPHNVNVRLARGLVQRRLGDVPAALEDYDAVLAAHPNQVQALIARGLARMDLKDFVGASEDLRRALKLIPPRSARWEQVEQQLQKAQDRLGSSELRGFRLPPGIKDD